VFLRQRSVDITRQKKVEEEVIKISTLEKQGNGRDLARRLARSRRCRDQLISCHVVKKAT